MERIEFHTEDIDFALANPERIKEWIIRVVEQEGKSLKHITYLFCSDEYLHGINVTYLQHDTYTDIITFPLSAYHIESDIFISVDRVKENATTYDVPFEEELKRVIIHGVLHLCGYKDKTPEEETQMRQKENEALSLY